MPWGMCNMGSNREPLNCERLLREEENDKVTMDDSYMPVSCHAGVFK